MMKKNKRMHIAIVSAQDKIITISQHEFCHESRLHEGDGKGVDPLSLGGPRQAKATCLSQGGAELPQVVGQGGTEGGGGQ